MDQSGGGVSGDGYHGDGVLGAVDFVLVVVDPDVSDVDRDAYDVDHDDGDLNGGGHHVDVGVVRSWAADPVASETDVDPLFLDHISDLDFVDLDDNLAIVALGDLVVLGNFDLVDPGDFVELGSLDPVDPGDFVDLDLVFEFEEVKHLTRI